VNSALQRARKTVEERLPDRSQQAALRSLGDERVRKLVEAYVDAWARADIEAIRELLAEDAVVSMPPWSNWWRGRDAITTFAAVAAEVCPPHRVLPTRANGQPAVAYYSLDEETGRYTASAIAVLTIEGSLVKEDTGFVSPEIFPAFGLPVELD
jgi:RNA polymerase sigma-70 factor (ECF subfamily)